MASLAADFDVHFAPLVFAQEQQRFVDFHTQKVWCNCVDRAAVHTHIAGASADEGHSHCSLLATEALDFLVFCLGHDKELRQALY